MTGWEKHNLREKWTRVRNAQINTNHQYTCEKKLIRPASNKLNANQYKDEMTLSHLSNWQRQRIWVDRRVFSDTLVLYTDGRSRNWHNLSQSSWAALKPLTFE